MFPTRLDGKTYPAVYRLVERLGVPLDGKIHCYTFWCQLRLEPVPRHRVREEGVVDDPGRSAIEEVGFYFLAGRAREQVPFFAGVLSAVAGEDFSGEGLVLLISGTVRGVEHGWIETP